MIRSQLIWICTVCHSVCEFISTIWIKKSDWLVIRNGRGILIYSAGPGLNVTVTKTLAKVTQNCSTKEVANKDSTKDLTGNTKN